MPCVRYLNHDISKNWRRYIFKSTFFFKSANFLKIPKTCLNRQMAFEAKMIYVLVEIECNYILKHVFDDKISYFTNYTANMC